MKMKQWLIDRGVMGGIFPSLFDLPALWKINSTRFRGFNIVFFPFYFVFVFMALPYTVFCLIEGILGGPRSKKEQG
jgi:hypothetical protein